MRYTSEAGSGFVFHFIPVSVHGLLTLVVLPTNFISRLPFVPFLLNTLMAEGMRVG
jgi:hypothetical protein